MARPSLEDFLKQFDRITKPDQSMRDRIELAEAIIRMSSMSTQELISSQESSWEFLHDEAVEAAIKVAIMAPSRTETIERLIRFAFRAHGMRAFMELLKSETDDNPLEANEEFIKHARDFTIERAAKIRDMEEKK